MGKKKCAAIVLAAGSGKRMKSTTKKQYLLLNNKPVLYYALKTFEDSQYVDEIILVTAEEDIAYCRKEYKEKYHLTKLARIVAGGKERQDSVYAGLQSCTKADIIMIHDGARPFVSEEMIRKLYDTVIEKGACIAAVPSKDTVKIVDEEGAVVQTPDRRNVWNIQTPQAFSYSLISQAFSLLQKQPELQVTDDAMLIEMLTEHKVYVVESDYTNLKITTPEDLLLAEEICKRKMTGNDR